MLSQESPCISVAELTTSKTLIMVTKHSTSIDHLAARYKFKRILHLSLLQESETNAIGRGASRGLRLAPANSTG